MIEFNLCGLIATCLVGAFLLGIFNEQVQRQGWFSKVMIVGLLSTLVSLLPSLQKGISLNWGLCYILVGILILNMTLLLGFSSLSCRIKQVAERINVFACGVLNSKAWRYSQHILSGIVTVLFNLSVFFWAIVSYRARQKKVLALPQGMGNPILF